MIKEKRCFQCGDELTYEDNGISLNDGDFYQCSVCHYNEFGYLPYWDLLVIKQDMYDLQENDLQNIKKNGYSNNG